MPRPVLTTMSQAIITQYIPATSTKPPRIRATTSTGLQAEIPYQYHTSEVKLFHMACLELVAKHGLDWDVNRMCYGGNNDGFVFCFPDTISTLVKL